MHVEVGRFKSCFQGNKRQEVGGWGGREGLGAASSVCRCVVSTSGCDLTQSRKRSRSSQAVSPSGKLSGLIWVPGRGFSSVSTIRT